MTYLYCSCAFNLYEDGEHMRIAVNVRVMQLINEILHHSCKSNLTDAGYLTGSLSETQEQRTQGNRGD